jgi:hypothetical protein
LDKTGKPPIDHSKLASKPTEALNLPKGYSETRTKTTKVKQCQSSDLDNAFTQWQTKFAKTMIEDEHSHREHSRLKRKLEYIEFEQKKKKTILMELNNLLWLKTTAF